MPRRGEHSRAKENWWRATVERWKASGLTQAEFCRREGVKEWSLSDWRRRLARRDAAGRGRQIGVKSFVEFAPVTVRDVDPNPVTAGAPAPGWEVLAIRVPAAVTPEALRVVLEALRWSC